MPVSEEERAMKRWKRFVAAVLDSVIRSLPHVVTWLAARLRH